MKENENKRRQLEDQIDSLNEEVAKLRAQGEALLIESWDYVRGRRY